MKKLFVKIWKILKRILNAGWKLALILAGICIAIALCDEFNWLGRRWYYDGCLSENVCMKRHKGGYIQLFDYKTGKKLSSDKFESIVYASETDSLTVFRSMDGLRGYLNANTGKIEIPAQYRHAWIFSEGIGAVVGEDDSLRFIGHDGKAIFNKAFKYSTAYEYVFHNGQCIVTEMTGDGPRMGLIDRNGEWTIPQIYADISKVNGNRYYIVTVWSDNDYCIKGLLDLTGNWVLPAEYQGIEFSDCDNSLYLTKDYVKKHVSAEGKVLDPFVIDYIRDFEYVILGEQGVTDAGESYTKTATSTKIAQYYANGLCGILDLRTGKPLTSARFSDIYYETDNVIRCQLEGSRSEVIYNVDGKQIQ